MLPTCRLAGSKSVSLDWVGRPSRTARWRPSLPTNLSSGLSGCVLGCGAVACAGDYSPPWARRGAWASGGVSEWCGSGLICSFVGGRPRNGGMKVGGGFKAGEQSGGREGDA